MNRAKIKRAARAKIKKAQPERGFTLVETTIALLIMMIVVLGAASVFAYATYNNSSGADRTQTLAVAQQTLEILRNARFSTAGTDALLDAGTRTQDITRGGLNGSGSRPYRVVTTITDNPAKTLKTITVTVTPTGAGPAWARGSAASVTIVTQRARTDQP